MAPSRRTNRGILAGTVLLVIVVACIVTAGCTAGTSTPGTAAGLTGVSWSLDTYLADNGTLIPALPKSEVTARFDDDGKVVGSAGCNQYGSDYHLDGTVLSISPPISTKMYCSEPEGLMEQEARFLELLASAAECQIENNRLEIIDASGAPVLTFMKGIPIDLAGTSWTLTSLIDEGGSMAPIVTGTTVTAIFDAGGIRVSGLAGCNHYSADYTRNGADITIKSAVRTDMYCGEPEGLMDQEDRYLSLLTDVSSYWVEGDRLILSDKEGADLLVLDRAAEFPDLPLVGTDWVLDSYSTGRDAISSVITGTTITAKFTDDSKITGSAGCNHYGGEYLLDGANLSVSSLFSTLMYCTEPEGVMEQEARYLGLFDSVSGYRIDGDRLDLLDEVGKVLLSYRAGCTDQP